MLKISKQVTVQSALALYYFQEFKQSKTGQNVCALLITKIKYLILNVLDYFFYFNLSLKFFSNALKDDK